MSRERGGGWEWGEGSRNWYCKHRFKKKINLKNLHTHLHTGYGKFLKKNKRKHRRNTKITHLQIHVCFVEHVSSYVSASSFVMLRKKWNRVTRTDGIWTYVDILYEGWVRCFALLLWQEGCLKLGRSWHREECSRKSWKNSSVISNFFLQLMLGTEWQLGLIVHVAWIIMVWAGVSFVQLSYF